MAATWVLALVMCALNTTPVFAHAAAFTESTVEINPGGAVNLIIHFDVLAFALDDTSAHVGNAPMEALVGGPRSILEQRFAEARDRLLHGTKISTDTGDCIPSTIDFPKPDDAISLWREVGPAMPAAMDATLTARLPTGAKWAAFSFPPVLDTLVLTVRIPGRSDHVAPLAPGEDSERIQLEPTVAAPVMSPTPVPLATPPPRGLRSFESLVSEGRIPPLKALFFLLFAAVLGGIHALSPGHGKTLVAAYLIGSRGTPRHAVALGIIVAATHTAGVFLMGVTALYASHYFMPERLYPWLTGISGFVIIQIGLLRLFGLGGHSHHHHDHHDHDHHHDDHDHHHDDHDHHHHHHHPHTHGHSHLPPPGESLISRKSLVALGVSGGIVPCPSAIIVMLTAIALHRIEFGLLLIVAFSIGLASVLCLLGILAVKVRDFLNSRTVIPDSALQLLPRIGGLAIIGLGVALLLPLILHL